MSKVKAIYADLSSEYKLILLCLRAQQTEQEQQTLQTSVAGHIDWNVFVQLAVNHKVYPLIYRFLSTVNHVFLPREVVEILRQKTQENTAKALQMTGELVRVLRAMEEKGIRVVVLKGLPLADKLYGSGFVRPSKDLDLLVWPEDVDKARKVIEELNYDRIQPSFADTPRRLRNWIKTKHHFEYWHEEKEISIELHWKLGHRNMEIPLTETEDRLTMTKIAGYPVYMPGTEELLLFLVLHGAGHGWFRLKWLCDIAMLMRQGGFSWERLYGLAKDLGVEVLLNQAVILCQNLLAAPVPEHIAAITKDRKAQRLAERALPFIRTADFHPADLKIGNPLYFYYQIYDLSIQYAWRKKFTFLNYFSPTEKDIEVIALPDYLYFVYYLLRPFAWFSRRIAQLAGK